MSAPHDSIAQRVVACAACHGEQGRATPGGWYPRIAGKPAGYLFHQLQNFRDGRRHNAAMQHFVDPLSEAYLREIAGYFAGLDLPYSPPVPATASDAVLARGRQLALDGDERHGIPACASCHGARLLGVEPAIPGLLGLPPDYVGAQLAAWRAGTREAHAPDCMAWITRRLRHEDLHAVSAWLAAQPVPQPSKPAAALPDALPIECGGVGGTAVGPRADRQSGGPR